MYVQLPASIRKIIVNITIILKKSNSKRWLMIIEAFYINQFKLNINLTLSDNVSNVDCYKDSTLMEFSHLM